MRRARDPDAVSDPNDAARGRAIRAGIAVGVATATYGISFGALATASGLDILQTCFLSLVMFSGGSQFALIGILATGGVASGGAAIASATLLGLRNMFYAVRMSPVVGPGWWRRAAAAQLTIDESTAVAVGQPTVGLQRLGFWVTGISVFVGWNLATLIGGLIGNAIGDVRAFGLDAAASAAFLGLLWPRLKQRQPLAVAAAAAALCAVTVPFLPPGVPVLITVVVAVVVGVTNFLGSADPAATGDPVEEAGA